MAMRLWQVSENSWLSHGRNVVSEYIIKAFSQLLIHSWKIMPGHNNNYV